VSLVLFELIPEPIILALLTALLLFVSTANGAESRLRNEGGSYFDGVGMFNGVVFTPQTIIKVRWQWLVFLASQMALTWAILAITIKMTYMSGMQDLKDSSIATMCILDADCRAALGSLNEFRDVKKSAKNLMVRMERDGSGAATWLTRLGQDWRGEPVNDVPKTDR
jgi:hypothetical protein